MRTDCDDSRLVCPSSHPIIPFVRANEYSPLFSRKAIIRVLLFLLGTQTIIITVGRWQITFVVVSDVVFTTV